VFPRSPRSAVRRLLAWLAAHVATHPGEVWVLPVFAGIGIGVAIATHRMEIEL
jgi:hypothetical protein